MMASFTIANIAKRSGVPVEAIRRYESLGLLPRALRSANYRAFAEDIAPRVRFVHTMLSMGFNADEVAALLALEGRSGADAESLRLIMNGPLAAVERKLALLEALRTALLEWYSEATPKRKGVALSSILMGRGVI